MEPHKRAVSSNKSAFPADGANQAKERSNCTDRVDNSDYDERSFLGGCECEGVIFLGVWVGGGKVSNDAGHGEIGDAHTVVGIPDCSCVYPSAQERKERQDEDTKSDGETATEVACEGHVAGGGGVEMMEIGKLDGRTRVYVFNDRHSPDCGK